MATENVLHIPSNGRGVIVGQTGSGKTTLAQILILDKPYVVVHDPKHEFRTWRRYLVANGLDELNERQDGNNVIIYRPLPTELNDAEQNKFFRWVYYRKNTFVVIDEVTSLVGRTNASYPVWFRACLTQGRSRNIGMLVLTQRPMHVPLFVFSEARQFWIFRLLLKTDKDRLAEFVGDGVYKPLTEEHSFLYYQLGALSPKEYVLDIDNKTIMEG